jgi:hypothetical protein
MLNSATYLNITTTTTTTRTTAAITTVLSGYFIRLTTRKKPLPVNTEKKPNKVNIMQ